MVTEHSFQKIIQGVEVHYDYELDIISHDSSPSWEQGQFDRTQVDFEYDLCAEITTSCNLSCANCFSSSLRGEQGVNIDYWTVYSELSKRNLDLIRFCISGGEPFMHPYIEEFLKIPNEFPDLRYVINTNGTLRSDLDASLITNNWLVAISLHGHQTAHNLYTESNSFRTVQRRIEQLAAYTRVHIYCVLHDALTADDIDWILRFRADSGAKFVRFIVPRQFGRYKPLQKQSIVDEISERLDSTSCIKVGASKTILLDTSGVSRRTF